MTQQFLSGIGRTAFVAGAFLGLAANYAAAAEIGVTDTTIKIGMFGPLTGAASINGHPISNGSIAIYNEANAKGGIHGRKIEVINEDSACDPAKALAATKKLIHRDQVFMIHGGSCSTAVASTTDEVEKSGVPFMLIAATMDSLTAPVKKNIFTAQMTGSRDGHGMATFAASIPGVKRVALIGFASDWADTKINPAKEVLKAKGIEVVAHETVEVGVADTTAQVHRIKAAKPDAILAFTFPGESSIFLRDAWKYGLRGKFQGSPQVVVSFPDLVTLIEKVGNIDAVQDVYAITVLKDTFDSATLKPFVDLRYKYFPNDLKTAGALQGMAGGHVIVEALQRVGRDLTRQKFIDTLESIQNFTDHPNSCAISFSKTKHQGCDTPTHWTLVGDKVVAVGPTWRDMRKTQ